MSLKRHSRSQTLFTGGEFGVSNDVVDARLVRTAPPGRKLLGRREVLVRDVLLHDRESLPQEDARREEKM